MAVPFIKTFAVMFCGEAMELNDGTGFERPKPWPLKN